MAGDYGEPSAAPPRVKECQAARPRPPGRWCSLVWIGTFAPKTPMAPDGPQRPAWLNWLFLAIFLWSSWQLTGLWFERLGS
ncbi:hypothetical protein KBY96_00090 [Cyanobium sp. ATX 6A2]|uniref:hypothetical protein n=1 Tax=Cyanobium sp. ATX 6A2 TaxID=2823700 RepID=UPI0020CF7FD1|nr:hypothetical protein [Cyanobium sp. ATX 6A2]MCP9886341.1 hypothetical protein [Cyanobium sp. ATX 6A2]